MANANFKLKSTEKGKPTPIYLIVYFDKVRFKYSTGEKIDPLFWDPEDQRTYTKKELKENQIKINPETLREIEKIQFKLDEFSSSLKTYFEYFTFQREQVTPDRLREKFNTDFRPEQVKKAPKQIDLNTYIDNFIKEIESGKRLTPAGQRYKYYTIKVFKSFKSQFDNYQLSRRKKINFEHVTIDFYKDFLDFFNKKDYKLNTIGRHIKCCKALMRAAMDEGLHSNMEFTRKQFKAFREDVDTVYLTAKEVEKIRQIELPEPHLELARDVFLTGVYTAQRYGDYSRIKKQHISRLENGDYIIKLHQQKTGEKVTIPVKPELFEILEKYDFSLPKSHQQKVNDYIKIICERASINEPINTQTIKGGLKVQSTTPKHKLITTHTARRTGATLMYLAGIGTLSAMKITGHRTESEFLRYIRVTNEENAAVLAGHDYFRSAPMKIVN